jgi:nucleoside-triphosphatase
MKNKILITGKPGIGKTTVIKKIFQKLGNKAVGFFTEDYRDLKTHRRKGFKVITFDGKEEILADVNLKSNYKVGKYGVNIKGFEKVAVPVLEKALNSKDKIIIIDEIGKMEFYSQKFRNLIWEIMKDPELKVIATISQKDFHPIIKKIKNLPDVEIVEVKQENRNILPEEIVKNFDKI